ncbi:MAG TPA: DUF3307 domain-containing protein [Mucilaginibacter sp.]|jgi:hypothetical protein|nr:DUF3307 domain-containing protein [Mucilaginibacter sp.]
MHPDLLLRLITAHLLTDFVLQPNSWIGQKKRQKHRSGKLYLHVLIAAVTAYIFSGLWANWWLPLVILITHYLIDLWKLNRPENLLYFLLDQLFHLIVIVAIWLSLYSDLSGVAHLIQKGFTDTRFWAILAGYLIVTYPLGIIIGIATQKWREAAEVNKEGLAKAGILIGIFERLLILTFILCNQFAAVGFLVTAKSILRFSDKENTQKKTEYILIGTLMSFAASILVGMGIRLLV